jgi:histidinol-phosphate/aromatic aminotransferase/cobyric acid decarboxylase-like protein/choline kinase
MQAIILAAGMGSRLGKYTADNTKCMLSINGHTLIERALDALDAAGITHCVIVVGYRKENLMNFVGGRYKNIKITYVANDVYNKTNNIYSLYLAREYLTKDDTLLLESDLIFEGSVIKELLDSPEPTLAVVAPYESWMDGTVVKLTSDNCITSFIPRKAFDYLEKDSYYKTVNIYKFSKEFSRNVYVPFLEAYSQAMGANEYYEQVLRVIVTLDTKEIKALVLNEEKWYEIDDIQDKDIAEAIFCDDSGEALKRIAGRYGGYWRFPRMLDFCYLVNPYFPTPQMRNEIQAYFTELLSSYPSGLSVQNLLAGKLFDVDAGSILVGNGAAELIRVAAPLLAGDVGIVYPTFNEYAESLPDGLAAAAFYPPGAPDSMGYGVDSLIEWSARCGTLVLINPDNPSGNCIPASDILCFLEETGGQGKRLVLDESFIDFCDEGAGESLLRQDILDRFPHLVVIKSLSKSYGIPGIRLGVLASGDRDFLGAVRRGIPIWNINSFAESFLQIAGKYKKDYAAACRAIAAERRRFKGALEGTGLFSVYPSQANYFLCRCRGGLTAPELAKYLLRHHNIFIKDLTGKNGIPGDAWLRLAVRGRRDNDLLIEKLNLFKKG